MKLPEATNAMVHTGMILDRCRQLCLGTCSCRAYAAADVSGGINRGCIVWAVDLIDMRQYPEVVQDVYICLAQSEVDALTAAGSITIHAATGRSSTPASVQGHRPLGGCPTRFSIAPSSTTRSEANP
ncbi:G-type lectin S-receptor-like serine/threonine-protein kinase At4g27290 [Hordeum vulgare subsp. vulgare]|nr:G-type lectin S-receptor-like serine/threonine-protein kinase At4g27290 [Hordeum vulgare subsp. vulgare]XP_044946741.1 G-type lectin S-receptor-like serine/threonine-protein kinase At4g27290 [Hordeum vulgare subsp. vulgare]